MEFHRNRMYPGCFTMASPVPQPASPSVHGGVADEGIGQDLNLHGAVDQQPANPFVDTPQPARKSTWLCCMDIIEYV